MEYTLRSIHGLIHDVCPQLIFQQAVYQIRIEWLIFYQAAPLEWIIQGHRLWHLQHIPLHAFHHQVQFDFWKCYNKWSEINKNKARIRRKRILSLCTPNFLSYPCACLFVGLFVHTGFFENALGSLRATGAYLLMTFSVGLLSVMRNGRRLCLRSHTDYLSPHGVKWRLNALFTLLQLRLGSEPSIVKPKDEKLWSLERGLMVNVSY